MLEIVPGQTGQRVTEGDTQQYSDGDDQQYLRMVQNTTRGVFKVTMMEDGEYVTTTGQEYDIRLHQTTKARRPKLLGRPDDLLAGQRSVNPGCVPSTCGGNKLSCFHHFS